MDPDSQDPTLPADSLTFDPGPIYASIGTTCMPGCGPQEERHSVPLGCASPPLAGEEELVEKS